MLVYLDTNIWIYAYEDDPLFGECPAIFPDLAFWETPACQQSFHLGELLVLPARKNNVFAAALYRRLFSSPKLRILPYDAVAASAYADLRAMHRLKPLDALHLATAAATKVDVFLTQDTQLLSLAVPGIRRITDLASFV